mmetsp:Transcript_37004/g.82873  ORF Transcript_37004/g.82873 Transcript_37004/m.82873 type:complete len:239 (-) Transcript_37004:137-853(-)
MKALPHHHQLSRCPRPQPGSSAWRSSRGRSSLRSRGPPTPTTNTRTWSGWRTTSFSARRSPAASETGLCSPHRADPHRPQDLHLATSSTRASRRRGRDSKKTLSGTWRGIFGTSFASCSTCSVVSRSCTRPGAPTTCESTRARTLSTRCSPTTQPQRCFGSAFGTCTSGSGSTWTPGSASTPRFGRASATASCPSSGAATPTGAASATIRASSRRPRPSQPWPRKPAGGARRRRKTGL